MATLKVHPNFPDGQTAVLTLDGMVVGGISQTGKDTFSANTRGRIPAIDGVSGPSPEQCWNAVKARVRQGDVRFTDGVETDPDE